MWLNVERVGARTPLNIRKGVHHLYLSAQDEVFVDFAPPLVAKIKAIRSDRKGYSRLVGLEGKTLDISSSGTADIYSKRLPAKWIRLEVTSDSILVYRYVEEEEKKEKEEEEKPEDTEDHTKDHTGDNIKDHSKGKDEEETEPLET